MYTIPAPLVASSLHHEPQDLTYRGGDDLINVVYFVADSESTPGKVNVVGLDIISGESHCSCRAGEIGLACWHRSLVQAAWDGHPARLLAAQYNADQLARTTRKALNMVTVYRRRRTWRILPDDVLSLLACRSEAHRRTATRGAGAEKAEIAA